MISRETKTYKNLKQALANEAEAIVRYFIYAENARKQGNTEAALLFEKMAKNELEHAKVWYKKLHPEPPSVEDSIAKVAKIENNEWKQVYPSFAETAEKEGLSDISDMFTRISAIENEHERRFIEMHLNLLDGKNDCSQDSNASNSVNLKYCIFCGYPSETELEICPVCGAKDSIKE